MSHRKYIITNLCILLSSSPHIAATEKPSNLRAADQYSYILKASPGRGIGVFALHDIPAGAPISDLRKFKIRIYKQSDVPQELIGHCIHQENGQTIAPERFDRMPIFWYINHSSESPNITTIPRGISVEDGEWVVMPMYALKDIKAGDELLSNYNELGEPEDTKEDYYRAPAK